MLRIFLLIVMTVLLAGCSTLFGKNNFAVKRQTEYMRTQEVAPLQLPPCVNVTSVGDDYNIPPVMGNPPCQPINILPPGSLAAKIAQGELPPSALNARPACS